MSILKNWKLIAIFMSVLAIVWLVNTVIRISLEKAMAVENIRQLQLENSTLTLTTDEFKDLLKNSEQRSARHVDSLFKANRINPRAVEEVHNVTNTYYQKDSTIVMVPLDSKVHPVTIGDKCWGFSGTITNSQLEIHEKHFHSVIDLVDYAKPRKILFIRVGWHEPDMHAFTDCGTVEVKSYRRATQK